MDIKFFKKLGRSVSSLGLGTWRMGEDRYMDDASIAALKRGIELGATMIDTAEMYANGRAEELVGKAIKGFDRDELFIVTKVWPTNANYEGVLKAAKRSMDRLETFIDLYLLHWPSSFPICETMRAMEELVNKGMVKHIGLSNFNVKSIEEARACLKKTDIAAVQNRFSPTYRKDYADVIPYAQKEGMLYMAYTPIEKGALSGNRLLRRIGEKYSKTPIQIALNWLICIEPVVPIPKASRVEHVEENVGAMGWRLSSEDFSEILNRL
ncbi:MAG: aldo/keto reductase [Crenarchaeota archaeon]|nr:aldo/keto reductase [Thermoproteota archaeon]